MKKNIKKEWTIPFNPKYSHPTKLSQTHYLLFIIFYELNPDIRSTEILTFLSIQYGITIEKSWVNQKLAQSGCQRPIGRPNKEYTKKKNHYITCLENTSEYVDAIGIHFLIAAIDALGFTNCIIEALLSCIKQSKTSKMPSNANSLRSFLHNLMQLILDRRISNFEEAIRCEMPLNLSMEHTRKLTKATEYLYNIDGALYHSFFDFWTNKLKSLNISQYQIYIDGHGSPLYTKDSAVCGRMSITGEIKPGTHHVICTDQHGFILCLYPESVDKHLNHGLEWVCVGLTTRLGDAVEIVVVDRECCGAEINQFVKEYCNINILTGLRKNQYNGWNDFDYNWLIENELAVGKWSDKAKQQIDSRTFLIYPQKEHLYVLATTSEDDSIHKRAFGLQKKRWPVNEGVIKLLVGEFDFNVNVGNGRNLIDNPKIEKIDEILYEKCTKYDNRIGKLKQKTLKNAKNLLINQSTQKKILDKKEKNSLTWGYLSQKSINNFF